MGYGVRDKEMGKLTFLRFLLRHPLFDDQKTLYNYNKPKPTYFYGNINPNGVRGKYRWRGTGEGFTHISDQGRYETVIGTGCAYKKLPLKQNVYDPYR